MSTMTRNVLIAGALGTFLTLATGCLISHSSDTFETGHRVSPATLSEVEVGHTTRDWLIATLGEPTSSQLVNEHPHIEMLKYSYKKRKESSGSVFLIFAGSSSSSRHSTTYFELTNGVVTSYWSDD